MPGISHPAVGISASQVQKIFANGTQAISSLNFSINPGEFVSILGPSGCGKSTLLRIIAGLDRPTSGEVQLKNDSNSPAISYVFQDAHLLPWRNVLRNTELPLELRGSAKADRRSRAMEILNQVGLGDFAAAYPSELSGGMRMRVSLARALITEPQLLLLDEPFAALDEITRQKLDELLRDLWHRRRMTTIFVTHSTAEAVFLANRAIVMTARPGKISLDHTITLPDERSSQLRASAEFAEQTGVLYAALEGKSR